MTSMLESLRTHLGASTIQTDPELVNLYAHDVFGSGEPAVAVVRPGSAEDVQALVRLCMGTGTPLVSRGGGMSYTAGYLAEQPNGILLDLSLIHI